MKRPIRGVNLGGWLVLEPWITPSLFAGTETPDEFTYCDQASPARIKALQKHHKTWISRQDFKWLAEHGFEAVRIPVGYWIFGDQPPYVGAISYLDNAFDWAEEFGLRVLLCLHGAPGSQNGEMHSGRRGRTGWHTESANIELSLQVLDRVAQRYAGSPVLLGIEVLNEPSKAIPRRQLSRYYRRAYRLLRRELSRDAWVVFSDRFQPGRWWWVLRWPLRRNAVQDNHHYQIYTPQDKQTDIEGHVRKARRAGWRLSIIAGQRRLIIGEWSAALDPSSLTGLAGADLDLAYKRYISAQLAAFRHADGWFYWTYRTEDAGPWSLRQLVERGIFLAED